MSTLSVVVPTYNRERKLRATIEKILECTHTGLESVQVVVVDDGSAVPAEDVLAGVAAPSPFSLEIVRQENAGPARARNTGFRASSSSIVLFVDDDILAHPSLLEGHVAAHGKLPGSVVFGRYPWEKPANAGAFFRVLEGLGHDTGAGDPREFVPSAVPASGHLSVERSQFSSAGGVYRDDLETPGAEEFELGARLKSLGVPLYLATRITAIHDSPVALREFCSRQFKLGRGCAEAARRSPDALALPELRAVVDAARGPLKAAGSSGLARWAILGVASFLQGLAPDADALAPLYRLAIGAHFTGGVRDGLRRYGGSA